jgi:hypothetical protein
MACEVTVPDGLSEGDAFDVQLGSQMFEVVVPPGVSAGEVIVLDVATEQQGVEPLPQPPPQPPVAQLVEVTVPGGVSSGQTFCVELETGAVFEVECPPGLQEGDTMEVDVSDADPSPAVAPSSTASPPRPEPPPMSTSAAQSAGSPTLASPAKCGGSRFGDRFGSARFKQHYQSRGTSGMASSPGGSLGGGSPSSLDVRTFRTDALREPQPEEGCRFYVGQPIQMLRTSGDWTEGVVLELMHGFETMYRCRLGEGLLEKMCGEDEVRVPQPDDGFRFCRGQTVQVQRPNGLLELATVTSNTKLDRQGIGLQEPWYSVRLHPSATQAEALVETVHEEELQQPMPQLGCAFYVGQLVQGQVTIGTWQLLRVLEFEMVGYKLGYKCAIIRLAEP